MYVGMYIYIYVHRYAYIMYVHITTLVRMCMYIYVVTLCVYVGDVVFAVDMHKTEAVPFYGPCELILKAEIITVRNRVSSKNPHQQQFQWSIAHVKKFWVKSDVHQLVITVGRLEALIYVFTMYLHFNKTACVTIWSIII